MAAAASHPFPRLRWLAPAWLAVYLPAYTLAYGWANFLFLCNVAIVVTAVGLWRGNRLLISAGGVASLGIGLVWAVDFGARLLTGAHLLGVTSYMWDPQYPLFTRGLSLYHVGWPLLVLVCLARIGYDRRAWVWQSLFALPFIVGGRLVGSAAENINYSFADPIWGLQLGPAPVHLATIVAATTFVLYGAAHLLLAARFDHSRVR